MDVPADLRADRIRCSQAWEPDGDGAFRGVSGLSRIGGLLEPVVIDAIARMRITSASEEAAAGPAGPIGQSAREHRELAVALVFSLLIHALLLSLTFGRGGLWLTGRVILWGDRRIEAPDLRVVLVPANPVPAKAAVSPFGNAPPSASITPPAAAQQAVAPSVPPTLRRPRKPAPSATSVFAMAPSASGPERLRSVSEDAGDIAPELQRLEATGRETARVEDARIDAERRAAARHAAAQLDAQRAEAARQEAMRFEATRLEAEHQEVARQAAARLDAQRDEAARQEAARLEAKRQEGARLEAERQEAAQDAAARLEAQRQETARQEAARIEAARFEAERQEVARIAAAQLDAQRAEAARQEAARVEAGRLEAERRETARIAAAQLDAQRAEAARQEVARVEAARRETEREVAAREPPPQPHAQRQAPAREAPRVATTRPEADRAPAAAQATAPRESPRDESEEREARREAALRAIGRQLDEEAGRREAGSRSAFLPSALPLSLSTARRVRVWGRTHPNDEVIQYAEAWARKIQFNTALETVREVAKQPHTPAMVTVAIRSSGSVESVTFAVSSGVAHIDEAIRRIVESQKPYPAFPPALARDFDVIEIRRTWYFDSAVRLY